MGMVNGWGVVCDLVVVKDTGAVRGSYRGGVVQMVGVLDLCVVVQLVSYMTSS